MSFRTNEDNEYPVGLVVHARRDPSTKLMIKKYYQRIYYCVRMAEPAGRHLAYFAREIATTSIETFSYNNSNHETTQDNKTDYKPGESVT